MACTTICDISIAFGVQVAVRRQDIDRRTEETQNLAEDDLLVLGEIDRQVHSREMGLEQHKRLKVRRVIGRLCHLDRNIVIDPTKDRLLVPSYLNGFELGRRCHNFQHTLQLGLCRQRQQECMHRDVRNVVVGRDHGCILGRDTAIFLVKFDNLRLGKIPQRRLHHVRKVLAEPIVRRVCQTVVAGVGQQSSVEIGEGRPVNGIFT